MQEEKLDYWKRKGFSLIAAEQAILKRASEAEDLICVYEGISSQTIVYHSALWSRAIGNAQ